MTTRARAPRLPLGAEIALSFLAGAGTFVLVAVAVADVDSDVVVLLLAGPYIVAVVGVARFWSIAYAVPVAMAGLLAYDWYYLPPTHPLEFPDSANLVDLVIYLGVAVLVGELAAHASRRAESSQRAFRAIADGQAALRRIATLVAQAVPGRELLAAVAEEVGTLLDADATRIARYEDEEEIVQVAEWSAPGYDPPSFDPAELEGASVARAPILVEGRRWGVLVAWSTTQVLAGEAQARLTDFSELVATAIANVDARREVERLAEEQAALRRVATLVARGVPAPEVFAAVAREVGRLLGVNSTHMARYEPDGMATGVGSWSVDRTHLAVGTRVPLDRTSVIGSVFRTGRPARLDSYDEASPQVASQVRELGIQSSAGAPIVVDGHLWGVMVASAKASQPLAVDTESRIAAFTELVATAISNTEARAEVGRLAEEQAALRRVATLVARTVSPDELFEAVTREVGLLSGADLARMERYQTDGTVSGVGVWSKESGPQLAVGTRIGLEGVSIAALVRETSRPVRVDSFADASGPIAREARELGIRSSVGGPIVVEGRLWGVIAASSKSETPFSADTESQIAEFTRLVATAISNSEARAEVTRLLEEQAALRRVATLVAQERPAAEVFAAVAEEVGGVLNVDLTAMLRYESDHTATFVAGWSTRELRFPIGTTLPFQGRNIETRVLSTHRPARLDAHGSATGAFAEAARELGVRSAAGTPIIVEGRLWGVMIASSLQPEPLPPETESRIGQFTQLVATAISNLDARSELAASRARIVAATDEARRRFERDLHDGAQQRLVSLALELRGAETMAPPERDDLRAQLSEVREGLTEVLENLRVLSQGIHPAILSEGGLGAALKALARRSAVPTRLDVNVHGRLEERVEVGAYYVVSEALANAAKHARASVADVRVESRNGVLDLTIDDDGVGGADPARGSGLTGLSDRVEALGGTLVIASPGGKGTSLHVELPLPVRSSR